MGFHLVDDAPFPPADGGATGYDTLLNAQVAKNTLVVGSVVDHTTDPHDPATISLSAFSSCGPTDDGRIKPDVVANGDWVHSSVGSADDHYGYKSGTSMASPNAAGTAALLLEHYRDVKEVTDVASATLKGLIIHTATDAGNPGPDYSYGYGLVNAAAAADFITGTEGTNLIVEDEYAGEEQTVELPSDPTDLIKVTLAWTDPAPDTLPSGDLDDPLSVLVNKLDLWLTGPAGTFYPWTLDPNNPSLSAVQTAANLVDNVEQVLIENPLPGAYIIHVGGTLDEAYESQLYSLLASVSEPNQWKLAVGESYNDSANWANDRVPDGVNAVANFLENIEENSEVTVDSPVTVGTINFDNAYGYTIAGPATVTLETSEGDAEINVAEGDHTILAPLSVADALTVDTAEGSSLTLGPNVLNPGGDVNLASGTTLKASGVINRLVYGDLTTEIIPQGDLIIGDVAGGGYTYGGQVQTGPYTVTLVEFSFPEKDPTGTMIEGGAKIPGAVLGGGTLSTTNGLHLLGVDWGNMEQTMLKGQGTVNTYTAAGDPVGGLGWIEPGEGNKITFTGVLKGSYSIVGDVEVLGKEIPSWSPGPSYNFKRPTIAALMLNVAGSQMPYIPLEVDLATPRSRPILRKATRWPSSRVATRPRARRG